MPEALVHKNSEFNSFRIFFEVVSTLCFFEFVIVISIEYQAFLFLLDNVRFIYFHLFSNIILLYRLKIYYFLSKSRM